MAEHTSNYVIAKPNDRAISDLAHIKNTLIQPKNLIPEFQKTVMTRQSSDPIGLAIGDMRAGSFSQVPIIEDNKIVSLLTAGTTVRWLASEVQNEIVSLETPISTILPHVEDEGHSDSVRRPFNAWFAPTIFKLI